MEVKNPAGFTLPARRAQTKTGLGLSTQTDAMIIIKMVQMSVNIAANTCFSRPFENLISDQLTV